MSRLFYHTMQDNAGNLLFGVSGTMRIAGSGTVATIYGDEAMTVILPNPMTNHPNFASFKCFLGAGDYDFYMAKAGYTFETLTGVQGYGSMAQQEASAVAITGGTVEGLTSLGVLGQSILQSALRVGSGAAPGSTLDVFGGAHVSGQTIIESALRVGSAIAPGAILDVTGDARVSGLVGIGPVLIGNNTLHLGYDRAVNYGLRITPSADTGAAFAIFFANAAGTAVGSVTTTGAATAYNTTSDARLKHAVTTLVGELAVIRALRPVRFQWRANDAEGVGFLAHEVAEHVQGVVTGKPDAVDEDGKVLPQMIDMSKLVPWLVGAVQALATQVETLMEQVTALEAV